jgi:biotin carboxyl carrier protein
MKKLRVTVEGKAYDVLVEILEDSNPPGSAPAVVPPPALVATPVTAEPAAAPPAAERVAAPGAAGDVASPLAGKVVSIDVKVGQAVAEGAQVATIEAMKMNTYIFAPGAGRVTAVLVNPGDGVEEGTVLLQLG